MIKIGENKFIELESTNYEYAINRQGILINSDTHKIISAWPDQKHTGYPSYRVWVKSWHKNVTVHPHKEVVKYFDPPDFEGYEVHHVFGKWRSDRDALLPVTPKQHRQLHKQKNERELNSPCLCFSVEEHYIGEYSNWFLASVTLSVGLTPLQLLRRARDEEIIAGMFLEPMPPVTVTKVRGNK